MKYSKMFIIFMVLSIFVLEAQEKKEKDASFFLSPSLSTWGLNTIIGYRFSNFMSDNMNTAVFTGWGGGYLGGYYYRLPDGTVFSHPVDSFSEDAVRFSYWTTLWQVGVRQGLFSKGWHDYLG
ncbi:MAG: hypothetical protein N2Z76_10155, partial [Treponemataceae bacterium]|nr:hypothetical protein [Treponemataceae bacterium]